MENNLRNRALSGSRILRNQWGRCISVIFALICLTIGQVHASSNNLRFPGMYHDEETGLYYNGQRYYDPEIGRYIQPDRIGLEGGFNQFEYAYSNPLIMIDNDGEAGIIGAGIGTIVELGVQLKRSNGNFRCIDWFDVGVAAVFGFVAPGLFSSGKSIFSNGKNILKIQKRKRLAKKPRYMRRLRYKQKKSMNRIVSEVLNQVVFQGGKYYLKKYLNKPKAQAECGSEPDCEEYRQ